MNEDIFRSSPLEAQDQRDRGREKTKVHQHQRGRVSEKCGEKCSPRQGEAPYRTQDKCQWGGNRVSLKDTCRRRKKRCWTKMVLGCRKAALSLQKDVRLISRPAFNFNSHCCPPGRLHHLRTVGGYKRMSNVTTEGPLAVLKAGTYSAVMPLCLSAATVKDIIHICFV